MDKLAQKYKSPEKQALQDKKDKLFQAKKIWNSHLKEFKEKLKETQSLINGRVEGRERIKLYEHLPDNTEGTLHEISKAFYENVEDGLKIYHFQNDYSDQYNQFYSNLENKRIDKLKNFQNLEKSANSNNLAKEASIGPVGLFWETIKSLPSEFFGKDSSARKAARRITFLKQLYDMDRGLSSIIDNSISSRSQKEIDFTKKLSYNTWVKCKSLLSLIKSSKISDEQTSFEQSDKEDKILPKENDDLKVQKIKEDLSSQNWVLTKKLMEKSMEDKAIESAQKIYDRIIFYISKYESSRLDKFSNQIFIDYKNLKDYISGFESFSDYINFSRSKIVNSNNLNYQILKLANDDSPYDPWLTSIKRFFKSIGLKMNVFIKIKSNLNDVIGDVSNCRTRIAEKINDLRNSEIIDYQGIEEDLKSTINTLEGVMNNLDSVSNLISSEGITAEQMEKADKNVQTGLLRKFFRGFKSEKK